MTSKYMFVLSTPNSGEDVKQQGLSFIPGGNANCTATLEDNLVIYYKTKHILPISYGPAIMILGIYSNELKTYVCTKSCTWMFTATLVIIVKTWKQARCFSIGEWRHKL